MNKDIEKKIRFSIKFKFFITVISIILFVSLSIIITCMVLFKNELKNEFEKRGHSEVKNLAYDAKYGVFTEDTVILSQLVNGRMKKPDVVYVIITNEIGIDLAKVSKVDHLLYFKDNSTKVELEGGIYRTLLTTKNNKKIYEFTSPVLHKENSSDLFEDIVFVDEMDSGEKNELLSGGIVKIGMSLENVERRSAEILSINILITLIVISVTIIIALFFIRMLVKPIITVTQAAMEISKGDLTKTVEVKSTDEISIMADNFNRMTTSLKNTIDELEELRQDLEQKVIDRTNDLNVTINELEKAYKDLQKMSELKTNFISSVSHELRTPLTSIIGFAKLMKSSLKKRLVPKLELIDLEQKDCQIFKREIEDFQEGIIIIVSEGERLTRLINDVLDIAKMEAGKVDWNDQEVDLNEIISSTIIASNCLIQEKNLEVTFENDELNESIYYDKDKLMQVTLNLLNNAIKFTDQGKIECFLRNKIDTVEIEIRDDGIGISEGETQYIFDKFKQVGTSLTNKPKGTGLGLPICKEIVRHYGGDIWVTSKEGQGTSFFFTIPFKNQSKS